jgi:hypothetical protein
MGPRAEREERSKRVTSRGGARRAARREAQVYRGEESVGVERLPKVRLRAAGQHLGGEVRVRISAEHYHRRLTQERVLVDGAQHRRAHHVGQVQIKKDQVGPVLASQGEP